MQTSNEFWRDFQGNLSALGYPPIEALRQAGYIYDAIWTAAFALDEAERRLKAGEVEGRSSLTDFNYKEEGIGRLILEGSRNVTFMGVTVRTISTSSPHVYNYNFNQGPVSFNKFGDREPRGEIHQYLCKHVDLVGE